MALPLFDDVVVDAVPPRDGPVQIHAGYAPTAAHTSARLSATPFELEDSRPKSHRLVPVRYGTPCFMAFWSGFQRGADGQGPPAREADEHVTKYTADGYHVGRIVGAMRQQQRVREEQRARDRRAR